MATMQVKKRNNIDPSFLNISCSPLLKQLYANRGIICASELDTSTRNLLPGQQLKGTKQACQLFYDALLSSERIIVVGDFDADGATSTALTILALRLLGFTNIDYLIPNRFDYGYGLSPEIVDIAIGKGAQLLMTVDNGISSVIGVAYAKQKGLKVLVTDHHLPAEETPVADVIVNPNQAGCPFPSKNLAGVGVAFYVMLALRAFLAEKGCFANSQAPNLASLLDIVALGTVADVVTLDTNNRILVQQGLARIRAGVCRVGISALIRVAKRNQAQLVASDLGFSLGPRLNAAGRLDEMSYGVELLLCEDYEQADILANELDALNQSRKEIEQGMQDEAVKALQNLHINEEQLPYAICLFDPQWHQGVIGLVASRIKEAYYRPTFVFAKAGDGEIKASARSIPGVHIRDMLDLVDKRNPDLVLKFGGHAMAAGLSIKESNFELFTTTLNAVLQEQVADELLNNVVLSDGQLNTQQFNLEQALELRNAGPWGQGFPAPLFDGSFKLLQQRLVGEKHLKMVVQMEDKAIDAIAFNVDIKRWPDPSVKRVYCTYRLDINEFRGKRTVQLLVEYLQAE
jgi:single-stranded-DNA-specific exonuclease